MKNLLKQKLSLFLALVLAVTMILPAGMVTSAAASLTALDGDVTDKVDTASATGSASNFEGEVVANIFDLDTATKYCAPVDSFPVVFTWSMTDGEQVALQSYALTTGADSGDFAGRDFQSWVLYGSNDGETWNVLDVRADQVGDQNSYTQTYSFENTEAYSDYKLVMASNTSGNTAKIMQLADLQISTTYLTEGVTTGGEETVAAAEQAAQAMDSRLAALVQPFTEDEITTISQIAADYKELSSLAKVLMTNYQILVDAQQYVTTAGAVPNLNALIASIKAAMDQAASSGEYDYHLNGDITHAIDLYNSLSAEDKAKVSSDYENLAGYLTTMDAQINNDVEITVSGWDSANNATKTPWLQNADVLVQTASQTAVADELKYQYARQGYVLGDYLNGTTVNLTASWGEAMVSQFDTGTTDNIGNPWNQAGRMWAVVAVPFGGTAFSVTGFFALSDTVTPISDAFYYDGKVYQQFFDKYKSYDYAEISADNIANVSLTATSLFPGSLSGSDVTSNTFRLAYAKYNQENKWDGVVLGVPVADVQETTTGYYQEFVGPNGTAYIAASKANIAAADINNPQENVAFVFTGDDMNAIIAQGTDFATGLAVTGAPVSKTDDGVILFENGTLEDGTYAEYDETTAYYQVIRLIDAIPDQVTKANQDAFDAAVQAADTAYNALTANTDKVTNYSDLTAAKAAYDTFVADLEKADEVTAAINEIPDVGEIVYTDEDSFKEIIGIIVNARTKYDALTSSQKALVEGGDYIVIAENALTNVIEELIQALPANTAIDGDTFDDAETAVNTAKTAYDCLPENYQSAVNTTLVQDLERKLEIISLGGYTAWLDTQVMTGDVDGDKKVSVSDVIAMRKIIMSGTTPTDTQIKAGDFDNNGSFTVSDVIALRKLIMKG